MAVEETVISEEVRKALENTLKGEDFVYIPSEEGLWEKARVSSVSDDGKTLAVENAKKQVVEIPVEQTQTYDVDHQKDWGNAFEMGDLNEPSLLFLLERRTIADSIYTFLGDILVSVNPYRDIENMYSPMPKAKDLNSRDKNAKPHVYVISDRAYNAIFDAKVRRKSQSILISGESGAGKTEAAKHLMAYLADLSQNKRQELQAKVGNKAAMLGAKPSVNILAKKGRGKSKRGTLIPGRKKSHVLGNKAEERSVTSLERIILKANPLIEAFGNAKTIRNDNSSRFGKFVQLQYDDTGVIVGAQTKHFLLEKSRIVNQGRDESNYHIFYRFCGAYENDPSDEVFDKVRDFVKPLSAYKYLTNDYKYQTISSQQGNQFKTIYSGLDSLLEKDNDSVNKVEEHVKVVDPRISELAYEFKATLEGLESANTSFSEQQDICRVLAGILSIGNIEFIDLDAEKGCKVSESSQDQLRVCSYLLGVEPSLLEVALVKRTVRAARRASFQQVPLNVIEAIKSRDGLAKAIYEGLFEWVVEKVNTATSYTVRNLNAAKKKKSELFIGILDIFGFEIFDNNSFEQLCINFANESLQNMFDDHVKAMEKKEYEKENLPLRDIKFRDNQLLLKMLNSKGTGIFQLMDEQGTLGKRGSDERLLRSIDKIHGDDQKNPFYKGKKKDDDTVFIIQHFSGPVEYSVIGMVEKNADHLQPDLSDLIKEGAFNVDKNEPQAVDRRLNKTALIRPISGIFSRAGSHTGSISKGFGFLQALLVLREEGGGSGGQVDTRQTVVSGRLKKGKKNDLNYAKKMAQLITVSNRFLSQMKALERLLKHTDQHYVRCIKPNEAKVPANGTGGWDSKMVVAQLEMLGALQIVEVRRQGYPVRTDFANILRKYSNIVTSLKIDWIPGDNDRQACAQMLNSLYPGEKGNVFVMGENRCFMKEKTLKELEALERTIEPSEAKQVEEEEEEEVAVEEEEEENAEKVEQVSPEQAQKEV